MHKIKSTSKSAIMVLSPREAQINLAKAHGLIVLSEINARGRRGSGRIAAFGIMKGGFAS